MKLIWGSEQSYITPLEGDIFVRTDNPISTPYISLSHEIAHRKLGHHKLLGGVSAEIDAWELTILQLMQSGEWNEAVKEEAIYDLNSYLGDEKEARWWIDRMEKHARDRLGYIEQ